MGEGAGGVGGGSQGLLVELAEHWGALDADLGRLYQLDVTFDLGTPRLPWRRLRALIRHLPADAALVRKLAGPAPAWGATEHLLASVVDSLSSTNYLLRRAHFKGNPTPPKPVPRPVDRRLHRDPVAEVPKIRARLAAFYAQGG